MQAAAAGTGVRLSDGSTNVLPVGDADEVLAAWANHHRLVRRSLEHGYYQGWDLHPAQLPTRYAATYAFYREGLARALDRLAGLHGQSRAAIADEPATARALAGTCCAASTAAPSTRPRCGGLDLGVTCPLAASALGSGHGQRSGSQPVRQGGEPRRPHRPRHPAARDPRPQRVDVPARRLRRRAHHRRPGAGAADRHPEEHRVRLRQDPRHRLDRGLRAGARQPADGGVPGRERGARCGSRSTPGTGSATTRSYAAAARSAPAWSPSAATRPTCCPASRSWCCSTPPTRSSRASSRTSSRPCPRPTTGSWRPRWSRSGGTRAPTSTGTRRTTRSATACSRPSPRTYSRALQETLHVMGCAVLDDPAGDRRDQVLGAQQAPLPRRLLRLRRGGLTNDGEVFIAADRPYGLIEAQVSRDDAPPAGDAWLHVPGFC